MGERKTEQIYEEIKTIKEKKVIPVCDDCGEDIESAGKRLFGYKIEECDRGGPKSGAIQTNAIDLCRDCLKDILLD